MKFFYQLFFIFLFLSSQAFASEDPTITNPFLWKATKNNQTIYLFGTIHKHVNIKELPDEVFSYIDSSENFFTEGESINNKSLDSQMEIYASKKQLKIEALDSFNLCDICLMTIATIPYGLSYILNYSKVEKGRIKLVEEYRLGGESAATNDSKFWSESPKIVKNFLFTKRHNKWMPKILEQSKEGQTFVAAGVDHFYFPEDNILDRLKEEGFKVKRIKMKKPVTHKRQNNVCAIVFG